MAQWRPRKTNFMKMSITTPTFHANSARLAAAQKAESGRHLNDEISQLQVTLYILLQKKIKPQHDLR